MILLAHPRRKGTQAEIISQKLALPFVGRATSSPSHQECSPLGKQFQSTPSGKQVPDELRFEGPTA
jgi:hypothetical protein